MPSKENDEERTAQQHTHKQTEIERKKFFEFVIPASTFFFFLFFFSFCSRTFRSRLFSSLSFSISFVCCVIKRARPPEAERERERRETRIKWQQQQNGKKKKKKRWRPRKKKFLFFFRLSLSLSPELSFAPVLLFQTHTQKPFPQRIRNKKTTSTTF